MIVRRCGGELNIAFSGDRDSLTCPWGKTEIVRSSDEGNWSAPVVVRNTPLDDRDAGLVESPAAPARPAPTETSGPASTWD